MKKVKILSFATLPLAMALLAGCGHEHTFDTKWNHDDTKHWHDATCEHKDVVSEEGNHIDDNLDGKCDVCGYEPEVPPHEHHFSEDWTYDATHHWHVCEESGCDAIDGKAEHVFVDGECECGYKEGEHHYYFEIGDEAVEFKKDEENPGEFISESTKINVGDQLLFKDLSGSDPILMADLVLNDDLYGFSLNEGKLSSILTGMFSFRLSVIDSKLTLSVKFGAPDILYQGFVFVNGRQQSVDTFAFIKVDKENGYIESKSHEAEFTDKAAITLNIGYPIDPIAVKLVEGAANADFELSEDGKTLTYKAAGDNKYVFYLRENIANSEVSIVIEKVSSPTPAEVTFSCKINDGEIAELSKITIEGFTAYFSYASVFEGDVITFYADGVKITENITAEEEGNLAPGEDSTFVVLTDCIPEEGIPSFGLMVLDGVYIVNGDKKTSPLPGEALYAYKLNDDGFVTMYHEEKNDQWEVYDLEMKAGDTIAIANIAGSLLEPDYLTHLKIGGETQGFLISDGVLTAGKDGVYSFYLVPDFENDLIYIADNTPVETKICLMGVGGDWSVGLAMEPNGDSQTEYKIEGVTVSAGETIKVKAGPTDDDYVNYWKELGENSAFVEGVCYLDEMNNAAFRLDALVNIYFESAEGDQYGVYVELKKVLSPYTGTVYTPGESQSADFKFNKIEANFVEYKLEAPGVNGLAYEICKNGSPITVEIEEGGAKANFTQDGSKITYIGSADTLTFYLKDYGDHYLLYIAEPVIDRTVSVSWSEEWVYNDNAVLLAWVFGGDYGDGAWVEVSTIDGFSASVTCKNNATGMLLVRFPEGTTVDSAAWEIGYNKTNDISLNSENSYSTSWKGITE